MAADKKTSKSARKYEVKDKGANRRKVSLQDRIIQIDIRNFKSWDQDKRVLAIAVLANATILLIALIFWILYATCGSGKAAVHMGVDLPLGSGTNGVGGPAAEHAAASDVTFAGSYGDSNKTGSDSALTAEMLDVDSIAHPTFECGVPETIPDLKKGRIVGGAEAVPHSWPYTVGLGIVIVAGHGKVMISQMCGATLISPKHALSAAHCFSGDPEVKQPYSIFARFHDRNTYHGVIPNRVAAVRFHPLNNIGSSPWLEYDFALLTLLNEFKPVPGLQFACLPPLRSVQPEGTICWAVGWGVTQGTGADDLLKQVAIDIVSEATCKRRYYSGIFQESTLCGGTTIGQDTCQGDSGGPLYCLDNGKWSIYGVTSYGPSVCGEGPMAAYGSVAFNIEWICCYMPSIPSCAGITCLPSGDNSR